MKELMENVYRTGVYTEGEQIYSLCVKTGLQEKQVLNWFLNRRIADQNRVDSITRQKVDQLIESLPSFTDSALENIENIIIEEGN